MKKILVYAMALVAMSFAACGGKTAASADADSLAVEGTAEEQAQTVVALLQDQLQNADPEQINAISSTIAEKVSEYIAAGDTAAAAAYTAVITEFLTENAEKLKNSDIVATVTNAISSVQGIPANICEAAQTAATTVATDADAQAAALQQSAEAVKEAVEAAPEAVKEAAKAKAEEAAAAAPQKAQESANKAIDDAAAAAKKKLGL